MKLAAQAKRMIATVCTTHPNADDGEGTMAQGEYEKWDEDDEEAWTATEDWGGPETRLQDEAVGVQSTESQLQHAGAETLCYVQPKRLKTSAQEATDLLSGRSQFMSVVLTIHERGSYNS